MAWGYFLVSKSLVISSWSLSTMHRYLLASRILSLWLPVIILTHELTVHMTLVVYSSAQSIVPDLFSIYWFWFVFLISSQCQDQVISIYPQRNVPFAPNNLFWTGRMSFPPVAYSCWWKIAQTDAWILACDEGMKTHLQRYIIFSVNSDRLWLNNSIIFFWIWMQI